MMHCIAPNVIKKPLQNHYTKLEALIYQDGLRSPKPHIQVRFLAGAPAGKRGLSGSMERNSRVGMNRRAFFRGVDRVHVPRWALAHHEVS
jgi:hypothetical protein